VVVNAVGRQNSGVPLLTAVVTVKAFGGNQGSSFKAGKAQTPPKSRHGNR